MGNLVAHAVTAEKIAVAAIVVPVGLALISGLFVLCKWLFRRRKDPDLALAIIDDALRDNKQLRQTVKQLEEELAQHEIMTGTGTQQMPQPSQEAQNLAAQIEDDAGPYALALKAIAAGNAEQADELLDETQQFLDTVQQKKDQAQAKIYMARMQNASYAGRHQDALQYCDRLTTLAGNDSLIINSMAAVYCENAKYKEAEPLMLRALRIDKASLGKDHPTVATRLNNLALLYKDTNRLKEAEPLMQRVVEILENPGAQSLPDYAGALNNLAHLYQATNRLKDAEPLIQRALKIDQASLGKDHPKVATLLNNLAALYQATNRLKEAEPLMQRVVEIFAKSSGENHPNVATALNNLAALYQATNRLKEAEPLMLRALKIDKASLGKDHPDVARDLNNLAQLYKDTNRLKEAGPLMERALLIFLRCTRRAGHPHPHLLDAINNYGSLLMQMGHTQNEVTARLKRLAPGMFESTDKPD
jgi:tetratricopeptide (TPR) repeat protein